MPLIAPSLDDRRFDDLVEDLLARIPAHTPEWTDPRQGDPGRTLIELFAYLGDALLYRANLIPQRQQLVFLSLLGEALRPARPAQGLVALQAAQARDLAVHHIQPRARLAGPLPFETLEEATVLPLGAQAYLKRALSPEEAARRGELLQGLARIHRVGGQVQGYETTPVFAAGRAQPAGVDVFAQSADACLWLALLAPPAQAPSTQATVNTTVRQALGGGGGAPLQLAIGLAPALTLPQPFEVVSAAPPVPVVWEMSRQRSPGSLAVDYTALSVVPGSDTTEGLTREGTLRLQLPDENLMWAPPNDVGLNPGAGVGDAPPRLDDPTLAGRLVAWLRLRPRPNPAGAGVGEGAVAGPQVRHLPLAWLGINAVRVEQCVQLQAQVLGVSNGQGAQVFSLPQPGVQAQGLRIEVEEPRRGYVPWQRVDDLAAISPQPQVARSARAFELNAEAGTLQFGDGLRGAVPEPQMRVRLAQGRFGGGRAGNLPALTLSDITAQAVQRGAPVPRLLAVQPLPLQGGEDAETLPEALKRLPARLRHRERAVTESDFLSLVQETPGVRVGRANVLPRFKPADRRFEVPGVVSVLALPEAPFGPAPNPRPDRPFIERLHQHLAARTPLATELYVIGCDYAPLALSVAVEVREGFGEQQVLENIKQALMRLLWPLQGGGLDATGWPLGRPVRSRELEVEVARVAGVDEVRGLQLFVPEASPPGWRALPVGADGSQQLSLQRWQLPELLAVVVVQDSAAPSDLRALPNPHALGHAVAVPVVPERC